MGAAIAAGQVFKSIYHSATAPNTPNASPKPSEAGTSFTKDEFNSSEKPNVALSKDAEVLSQMQSKRASTAFDKIEQSRYAGATNLTSAGTLFSQDSTHLNKPHAPLSAKTNPTFVQSSPTSNAETSSSQNTSPLTEDTLSTTKQALRDWSLSEAGKKVSRIIGKLPKGSIFILY